MRRRVPSPVAHPRSGFGLRHLASGALARARAATSGGQPPIAEVRRVLNSTDPRLRGELSDSGCLYVRIRETDADDVAEGLSGR